MLDMLLTGNLTDFVSTIPVSTTPEEDSHIFESLLGIHCGDRITRLTSFDQFLPAVDRLYNTSIMMGDFTVGPGMTCAQWKFDAKERYLGDFKVTTKNPVLLIGNTFDGHTPIRSAYNVSSGFKDSVVLEVNGHGVRNPC